MELYAGSSCQGNIKVCTIPKGTKALMVETWKNNFSFIFFDKNGEVLASTNQCISEIAKVLNMNDAEATKYMSKKLKERKEEMETKYPAIARKKRTKKLKY